MNRSAAISTALVGLFLVATQVASGSTRKLIITGWDSPDTAQFRRDLGQMEQWPFQGTVLSAKGKMADGRVFDGKTAFSGEKWPSNAFESAAADLKGSKSKVLTDNFLILGANPGDVDWFDDAGWGEIRDHCRLLARLARTGGLKGLLFDPEPYTEPHSQFSYRRQAQHDRHSFPDYCQKARQRGREVMTGIAGEFPDVVVFSYFLVGQCTSAVQSGNVLAGLECDGYGLLPAFTDGLLDALPPTATLIDGNESAYRYNDAGDFNSAFVRIKNLGQQLVSPGNRTKYRAQVQVSHGIYLDAYVNAPSSPWYIDGLGGPRVWRLEENTSSALQAADEYVWIYGEKGRWWPTRQPGAKTYPVWPEVLPHADLALLSARDPAAGAARYLHSAQARGSATNCLANGEFSKADRLPKEWGAWQDEKSSHGTFSHASETGASAKGSAALSGVDNGCFVQSFPAKPGERFVVSARTLHRGAGAPWLMVRWQTAEGKWTAEDKDVRLAPESTGPTDDWEKIISVVKVPATAGRLVVLLGATGQRAPTDQAWFDDAQAVRMER